MKITYANEEIKEICSDKGLDLNVEIILKKFDDCIGEKICVLEYSETESHVKTVKIQNIEDNSYKIITIKYDECSPWSFSKKPKDVSYLVTIYSEDYNDCYGFSKTYVVGEYLVSKLNDNYYNKKTGLSIKLQPNIAGNRYVLVKGKEICSFVLLCNEEIDIFELLDFENINLKSVYEKLKDINENYVKDIQINVSNKNGNEYEKLIVANNEISKYERNYKKDDTLITLIYHNGQIEVTTKQQLKEEEIIKTKEIDVKEELQKVKTLFKHN